MPHAVAKVGGHVIAETDSWEFVEGNIYFPESSIKNKDVLESSDLSTFCPWKGYASYWSIVVDGKTNQNAVWYYKEPYEAAINIKDHVAFDKKQVDITEE
ncbi:hypothetical protein ASPVEDRAFT_56749 [Aspergillus versicolor CBS 583.65]|uniref:DUF427 domain-containing protein n=1 Tax=Aspergillus versicolor CBS 583.65 TaxID=1036611 RepID=A0A1L9Q0U2_ASPVE|nr:uncharacterized protein ASPVEDRAFT_56749 [Aspergillus versicolor CBS 583.65]OJJ07339.1 hypothetical protein ASPVEDRAFT_56749 [Aspergillus versicolor CBS 583.65]